MPRQPAYYYRQSAVIPVRRKNGERQVLLITTRRSRRWIVPKGIVEPGLSPATSAEKEAWEEAGVRGRIENKPLGRYRYPKWGDTCTVEVFVMHVDDVHDDWPEAERKRRWVTLREAEELIREPGLKRLLRQMHRNGRAHAGE